MAMDSKVQISIQADFSKGTTKRLQESLDAMAKKLTLNIGKVKIQNQQFTKSIQDGVRQTSQVVEQSQRKYESTSKTFDKINKQFFESYKNHANKSAKESVSAFKEAYKQMEVAQKKINSLTMSPKSNKSASASADILAQKLKNKPNDYKPLVAGSPVDQLSKLWKEDWSKQYKQIQRNKLEVQQSLANQKRTELENSHKEALSMNRVYDTKAREQAKQSAKQSLEVQRSLSNQKRTELENSHKEALRLNKIYDTKSKEQAKAIQNKLNLNSGGSSRVTMYDPIQIQTEQNRIQSQVDTARNRISNYSKKGAIDSTEATRLNDILDGVEKKMSKISNNKMSKSIGNELGKVKNDLKLVAQEIDRTKFSFGNMLKNSISGMLQWSIAATAIYAPLRAIQSGVKYIYEMDNALNQIRIVTGKSKDEVEKLAGAYNKLGKEMGVSTKEIANTSVDLYRQGLSGADVDERMKSIIKYAKISNISLEDSNKIITATANATGESVTKIIDVFALLGDQTASGKHMCPAA